MQQIAEWLAKIGLERYSSAFVENNIDISVLHYLTDADLGASPAAEKKTRDADEARSRCASSLAA